MSYFKKLEEEINKIVTEKNYDTEITLSLSNRRDLGEFQVNDAMRLAKIYHKNPIEIANDIKEGLDKSEYFKDVNIAGAGFINISLSNKALCEFINSISLNIENNIDKTEEKTILLDYGGANVAKALHVGHLRSANIGEALNRLAKTLGNKTISDVHLGDSGLQAGLVVLEMKERFKSLPCFKDNYNGEEFDLPITKEDLKEIYPTASRKSKENEEFLNEARQITYQIQNNNIGYSVLWDKISSLSKEDIDRMVREAEENAEADSKRKER